MHGRSNTLAAQLIEGRRSSSSTCSWPRKEITHTQKKSLHGGSVQLVQGWLLHARGGPTLVIPAEYVEGGRRCTAGARRGRRQACMHAMMRHITSRRRASRIAASCKRGPAVGRFPSVPRISISCKFFLCLAIHLIFSLKNKIETT